MGVTLDTAKAHAHHTFGEVTQILTWMNDERVMVLLATHRKGGAWFVVQEPTCWMYDDPHYLARQARKAAEVLGIDDSVNGWFRLASIIHDGLPELVSMPSAPAPDLLRGTFGRMALRANGEVIREDAVRIERALPTYG